MDEEKAVQKEARYTREALAASAKYRPCCDALMILLEEGKESGLFHVPDTRLTAYLLQNIVKGMEVPFISGAYRSKGTVEEIRAAVRHLLLFGIRQSEEVPNESNT